MSLQLIKTPTGEVALVVNSQLILDGEAEDDSAKLTEQTAERLAMALNEPLQAIQVEPTAADWTWDDLVSHMATSAASQSRSSAEVKVTAFCYTNSLDRAPTDNTQPGVPIMPSLPSRIYGGRQIDVVAAQLIKKHCWFAVTPLPDDKWEVTVKDDAAQHFPDATRLPVEPILSVTDLETLGYAIRNEAQPPFRFYWTRGQHCSNGTYLNADVAQDDAIDDILARHALSRCDDCGKVHTEATLASIKHLSRRVDAGGPMPSGECDCGALAYLIEEAGGHGRA